MAEIWFGEKPEGPIKFEFFSLTDVSKLRTKVCELEIVTIEGGEYKGVSYFRPKAEAVSNCEAYELQDDFVLDVFMRLDPNDIEGLLEFQNNYGQIESPIFDTDTGSGDASFMLEPDKSMNVKKFEIGLRPRLNKYLKGQKSKGAFFKGAYIESAVPIVEVSRTVIMMQDLIAATSNLKSGDYSFVDYLHGETFNHLANRTAKRKAPVFGFAQNNPSDHITTVSIIDNVILHHMAALSDDKRKIWKCTQCGKYFQYKRREPINPESNHFCSPECSSRWHQYQYDKKKRESKASKAKG